jgi:hypothetical protein
VTEVEKGISFLGVITLELFDTLGDLKVRQEVPNGITDAGDLYIAQKVITGISPANASAPTSANGMKLGTGAVAPTKTDAGLGTYISGSNNPFDATYPQTNNLGSGLGVQARYVTTWAAGDVTNAAITEIVICTDATADEDPTAAETLSRATFSAINKTASDVLVATWNWKILGDVP